MTRRHWEVPVQAGQQADCSWNTDGRPNWKVEPVQRADDSQLRTCLDVQAARAPGMVWCKQWWNNQTPGGETQGIHRVAERRILPSPKRTASNTCRARYRRSYERCKTAGGRVKLMKYNVTQTWTTQNKFSAWLRLCIVHPSWPPPPSFQLTAKPCSRIKAASWTDGDNTSPTSSIDPLLLTQSLSTWSHKSHHLTLTSAHLWKRSSSPSVKPAQARHQAWTEFLMNSTTQQVLRH